MKLLYQFDEEGFYKEPIFSHDVDRFNIPLDRLTELVPPDFIRAKFVDGQWIEGVDDEYLETIKPIEEHTILDSVMEQNAFITKELASTQLANQELASQNAFVTKELAESKLANQILAEQQGSILLLLAQQLNTPIESEPETPPNDEPIEDNIPEEGDGQ